MRVPRTLLAPGQAVAVDEVVVAVTALDAAAADPRNLHIPLELYE
jgi:hypothetical protein